MKYIDADKLRAEIKKLQDIFVETAKGMETEDEATVYSMCAVEFGDELLAFIDSLPDEPVSDCHDLEEAAEEYASRYDAWNDDQDIAEYAFKAGAEWMAKQGVSYQATISADKTIPVLPMKDVSDMGLDYGDKVRIIILPEEG